VVALTNASGPRLLILGGAGMLGHKLWQRARAHLDVHVTLRGPAPAGLRDWGAPERTWVGIDVRRFEAVARVLDAVRPHVVVNAIGLIKQKPAGDDLPALIEVNALFPQRLARATAERGLRLIHVSSDCVYSGRRGHYDAEHDLPDPVDPYGRSKLLGEPLGPGCLTLRTSLVGRELRGAHGLLEWFLSQRGARVAGYTRAFFSGLSTLRFADLLITLVQRYPTLDGLHHVATAAISKHALLELLGRAYAAPVALDAVDEPVLDRSLDGHRFWSLLGRAAPEWPAMAAELAADPSPYDSWRQAK
jgi:dTDP-4-dehydrorhamnose reductase